MSVQPLLRERTRVATDRHSVLAVVPDPLPMKRAFDVVVGTLLAVLTIPLQLIALVVSAVSFGANPVFKQTRIGLGGEEFTFYKVRSLPPTAPSEAPKHELAEVPNSRVGKFLRRTHLDETIQLWSVISGSLSLVGPRPEMVGLTDSYDPGFVTARTSVRPGITGPWQISEASDGLICDAPEYDMYYVQHRSWNLELWVMWRTLLKMVAGRTVTIDELP